VPQRDGELSTAAEAAHDFVVASRAQATLRACKPDWHDFEKWCESHGLITLPAEPSSLTMVATVGLVPPSRLTMPGPTRRGSAPWRAALERIGQAGARPIGWVQLLCELQRDWMRKETAAAFADILFAVEGR
jgi:hypothetical protein